VKLKVAKDIYEGTVRLSNEKFSFNIQAEPEKLNNADTSLKVEHSSTYKPHDDLYKGWASLHYGSPKLGPLKIWLNVAFKWTNDGRKIISKGLNVQANDHIHVGYSLKHDTEKVTDLHVQAAYKNEKGDFFVKGDFQKHTYVAGCHHWHHDHKHAHSYELEFDATKGANQGI